MYEARQQPRDDNRPPITQSLYSMGSSSGSSSNSNQALPLVEEVTKRTELVTRRIQELWVAMQDLSKKDSFVPCSERIRVGIAELIAIFPQVRTTSYSLQSSLIINNFIILAKFNRRSIEECIKAIEHQYKSHSDRMYKLTTSFEL